MSHHDLTPKIEESVRRFLQWLEGYGYESYDQFDFWGSTPGIFSKRLFLKNRWIAAPMVLLLQFLESFFPSSRILFANKRRFAIGDAHFALGFQNLFHLTGKEEHLAQSVALVDALLSSGSKTENGLGWGYPYTWITGRAEYPPGTPFITVTPYCFEAILGLYHISKEQRYLDALDHISRFTALDLTESPISETETTAGYGPGDASGVINANTYRAALLLKSSILFEETEYREKAIRNINYVLSQQLEDGSWLYAPDDQFIDNFHTCFVLKNLYKSYMILNDDRILKAVQSGYRYYRDYLFRENNTPIHFSKMKNPKFRKIEMYDYAEGIALGPLLAPDFSEALGFSCHMAEKLIDSFQLKRGYFITRITSLNTRNKMPYLRWPQAQLFCALTSLLHYLDQETKR